VLATLLSSAVQAWGKPARQIAADGPGVRSEVESFPNSAAWFASIRMSPLKMRLWTGKGRTNRAVQRVPEKKVETMPRSKPSSISDLIAGFMRKYMPARLDGKTVVTNTTTEDNIALLKERGVKTVITTTPRYDGRSFGTNMMEAALTAYAGKGRRLSDKELNRLIDELELKPSVTNF
jgi:hypothetical protein